jgi:hypothetical protein
MLTERTLRKWRKDALRITDGVAIDMYKGVADSLAGAYVECQIRILRMTQELLDLHLTRKE